MFQRQSSDLFRPMQTKLGVIVKRTSLFKLELGLCGQIQAYFLVNLKCLLLLTNYLLLIC